MPKTIAYIRASTDKQDLNNQKLEIFEYARKNQLEVNDFIQITISSRKISKDRRIDEMILALNDADTLIVTELSRLGRSTADILKIKELLSLGLSVRKIATFLGYSNHIGLNAYIKKRNIKNLHITA